jgi:anti-anti-sigma regulatory factor
MAAEDGAGIAHAEVKLVPVLDAAAAADIKRQLIEALDANPFVDVDASAVHRVTGLALQVLAAGAKAARQAGGRLRLHSMPGVLSEAVETLGMAEALGFKEN